MPFFKTTKVIETQIDEFLDTVSQGGLVFKQGVKYYLEDITADFEERISTIGSLESKADDLSRNVEAQLYTQSLIPEHRGDVLRLLESNDNIIDISKHALNQFAIEQPAIPKEMNADFINLAEASAEATEAAVLATRAFMRNITAVNDHLHKVDYYEKEVDKLSFRMKKHIFSLDIDLALKIHLSSFVRLVELVSDTAQVVAQRLAISTIKRNI
ncbi:MAG: DUF47 family protein [Candidatus Electryonea clarkiae]|nr:DUF47 family protein [Candidatus Electryonea clarkiae]MDP8285664.1 DUF47 family protein [Candidatus Electryonea clarkiae]